jgi:hypothetical protein
MTVKPTEHAFNFPGTETALQTCQSLGKDIGICLEPLHGFRDQVLSSHDCKFHCTYALNVSALDLKYEPTQSTSLRSYQEQAIIGEE